MSLLSFLLPIQILVAIIAVITYKKYKSRFMFLLCLLLCLIAIVESIGLICLKEKISSSKLYNFYTFFEFNIITLMYLSLIKDERSLKCMKILCLLFNVIYFGSFIYIPLQHYTVTIGSVMVGVFLIMYLGELLQSNKILNYKKHLPFWVTVGFLIFYLASVPFSLAVRFMPDRKLFVVQISLIMIMNFCILYGLIWSKKEI